MTTQREREKNKLKSDNNLNRLRSFLLLCPYSRNEHVATCIERIHVDTIDKSLRGEQKNVFIRKKE